VTTVRYEVRDGVGEITLDRPERLNAFDRDMIQELGEALAAAESDREVGALLLTGAGRGFCAGMDLTAVVPDEDEPLGTTVRRNMERGLNVTVQQIVGHRVPVVTAVNGVAAGGGMGLALCGDVVLAARSATFLQVFAPRLAIAPDTGSTWLLPRLVGRARARGLTLLGDPLDADTAEEWGLVWEVHEDDELLDAARITARRLAAGPTEAFAWTRRLLDLSERTDLADQLQAEAVANGELAGRPDFLEGVGAFLENREPEFGAG
jgi:2-(1,2-epoxy-1,2-dihydrophenyl)acetyl-CoA isomerase